ncbi:hypothetical protein GGD56_005579 [Rhizobium mongolense]|uniref:Uncharacterized protein n=2 Tax=Rhizobium mongolense TaxID=57676 RepID=A0A7W6WE39_9HYPH|nr:hypothetical protein [Rhizobium mongolense]MBB4274148.1 hypothetical protein [Rhizobium mongolense]TVZ64270.1 hypothetical protein BCL32_4500 [Rhizobium mongolense USDA 1844]
MVYDWSGERARRLKFYKTAAACLFGSMLAGTMLLVITLQFHG